MQNCVFGSEFNRIGEQLKVKAAELEVQYKELLTDLGSKSTKTKSNEEMTQIIEDYMLQIKKLITETPDITKYNNGKILKILEELHQNFEFLASVFFFGLQKCMKNSTKNFLRSKP
jgi:hypothetical protein